MKQTEKLNTKQVILDEGLRKFMLSMYNHMSIGLVLTALAAFLFSHVRPLMSVNMSILGYLFAFAPIFMVFFFYSRLNIMSVEKLKALFYSYAFIMGISLSSLFLIYTEESLTRTFLITASVFGSMSLYGYTTKKDLTNFASFLMMGLIGIVIASIVNLFMHSSQISFIVSVAGVVIFTGLTAYDTQKLKQSYYMANMNVEDSYQRLSLAGALSLYMDFINLFLHLLRFMGNRKD